MSKRVCFLLLVAVAILLGSASSALATGNDFGPWYPAPGNTTTENPALYQYDVQPESSASVAEIANFVCLYPAGNPSSGQPISQANQQILSNVFYEASQIDYGNQLKDKNGTPSPYPANIQGMDAFLADQQQLIAQGGYVDYATNVPTSGNPESGTGYVQYWHQRYLNEQTVISQDELNLQKAKNKLAADQAAHAPSSILNADGTQVSSLQTTYNNEVSKSGLAPSSSLAALIDPTAATPLAITDRVPEGCGLQPITVPTIDFLQLFSDPAQFFTNLILYIPTTVTKFLYDTFQPYAFIYTFWTPHTERGDTIFNLATTCSVPAGVTGTQLAQDQQAVNNDCNSSNQPLGFSKTNLDVAGLTGHVPWYISVAIFLQWLVSGFYFIILFAAAVLYMIRGNKNTQMNVLALIPRLILSAILTIFAPYLIGVLITFANDFVNSLFSLDTQRSVGNITTILSQAPLYFNGASNLVAQLIQVIVTLIAVYFYIFFAFAALVRQIALIGLVILAPVACFALIIPRWQQLFHRYLRALLAVVFVPAILAFILKIGIELNPIVTSGTQDVNGLTGAIGLLLLLVTLWVMTRALRLSAAMATGNTAVMKSLTGRTFGAVGKMAEMAGMAGVIDPATGRAIGSLGRAGAAVGSAGEGMAASLIPKGTGMMGSSSGSGFALPRAGGSGGRPALPGLGQSGWEAGPDKGTGFGTGALALGAGVLAGDALGSGRGMSGHYQQFLAEKQAEAGIQRVTPRMAARYQRDLAASMAAKEQEMGRRLDRSERNEFLEGSFLRDDEGHVVIDQGLGKPIRNNDGYFSQNGELKRRNGSYYLTEPQGEFAQPESRAGMALKAPVRAITHAEPVARARGALNAAAHDGVIADPTQIMADRQATVEGARQVAGDEQGFYPDQRQVAQDYLENQVCPRCGGPAKGGVCVNPACAPEQPQRRKRRIAEIEDAAQISDAEQIV